MFLIVSLCFVLFFFFRVYLFLERREGREKEREGNINVREKHCLGCFLHAPNWWPGPQPRMCPVTGNLTLFPVFLDWGRKTYIVYLQSLLVEIIQTKSLFLVAALFSTISYLVTVARFCCQDLLLDGRKCLWLLGPQMLLSFYPFVWKHFCP